MELQGFDSITRRYDVVAHIYRYLNFNDQLRLAQVNGILRRVFQNCIWPLDYGKLKVYVDVRQNFYILTGGCGMQSVRLHGDGYQEFLTLYADDVQDLSLSNLQHIQPFKNLISLKCCLDDHDIAYVLKILKRNLPLLQNLRMTHCRLYQEFVEKEILEGLIAMTYLRLLSIHFQYSTKIRFEQISRLISQLGLQMLELTSSPSDGGDEEFPLNSMAEPLKVFNMTTRFNATNWLRNHRSFLYILENLLALELRIFDIELTNENLNLLAFTCKNLQKFTLLHTSFEEIKDFALAPQLKELRLYSCMGLTTKNLKQILGEGHQIVSFISSLTSYKGALEDFQMSDTLEFISIDTLDDRALRFISTNPQTIISLATKSLEMKVDEIKSLPLENCKNLHTLVLQNRCYVDLDVLFKLKHLHTLTTWIPTFGWYFIAALLRIPSLRHLHLIDNWQHCSRGPFVGFKTGVTCLKLENFYEHCADFFLDLVDQNLQMELIVLLPNYATLNSLRILLNHEKFPTYLKAIEFCGYTLDCADLRRDFDAATQHCKDLYEDFGNTSNRIVLRRSK